MAELIAAQVTNAQQWGKEVKRTMLAIAIAESGCDPQAQGDHFTNFADPKYREHASLSGHTSIGLWQVNLRWHYDKVARHSGLSDPFKQADWLTDPWNNAAIADEILRTQSLTAWATYNSGVYQRYLLHADELLRGVTKPTTPIDPTDADRLHNLLVTIEEQLDYMHETIANYLKSLK